MKKLKNFFTNSFYLKKLTRGSKYFSIQDFDIALTEAQNVFIKVPSNVDMKNPELVKTKTDYLVNYLENEEFLPKLKEKKQVHVWVYN